MCEEKKSPEGGLGKCNKMRDVGFLGEPPDPLKPGRMHKVVQSHHGLQIVPARNADGSIHTTVYNKRAVGDMRSLGLLCLVHEHRSVL